MTDLRETCADRGAARFRDVAGEIDLIGPSKARDLLTGIGWLSQQPEEFQDQVFRHAVSVKYRAGEVIYRLGDPVGGIYGFVSGGVIASVAPPQATPQLMHVLTPGSWTGEGPFLSRQPRRLALQAAIDTAAIYLPLEQMDQMAGRDPMATRRFTQILMMNLDLALKAFYDLQDPDEHRRIARALRRVAALEQVPIPLAQAALGMLSNTSRKTVNAALKRFAEKGWVRTAYRSIIVNDLKALTRFAESGRD
jgi:CRP-like cAMP-binding protein